MELYSLNAQSLNVEMSDFYDHFLFKCDMTDVTLFDLTNHPYTRSPKRFYEIAVEGG